MLFYAWERPYGLKFWQTDFEKDQTVDEEINGAYEVVPGLVGEQSPLKVDENMSTTIDGIYAAGDVCYDGSCAPGAVPAPPGRNRGSGILNAVFAGITSGEEAAVAAASCEQLPIDESKVEELKEAAYAPLFRASSMRKESRGWFMREDYPAMDNENWLKWIIVENDNGEMKFSTEDVPVDNYQVKPPPFFGAK